MLFHLTTWLGNILIQIIEKENLNVASLNTQQVHFCVKGPQAVLKSYCSEDIHTH